MYEVIRYANVRDSANITCGILVKRKLYRPNLCKIIDHKQVIVIWNSGLRMSVSPNVF